MQETAAAPTPNLLTAGAAAYQVSTAQSVNPSGAMVCYRN